ncbi:uncharacterized protein METZ01_LOCUS204333 [marine metagenome]|uniref:UDP-N-acetylmuramate dehydrogenase n=1 Tax=marine metagenome TaxID=408172 RepID=A0A382EM51_9ZZZZ
MLEIQENISLRDFNSFLLDKKARYFCSLYSIKDIEEVISYSKSKKLKTLVLGEGTNLLFTQDFDGLVLKNNIKGREIVKDQVILSGGENWHQSVLWTLQEGINGLENLVLIPGSVGAAPVQNIGAYGVEMASFISSVETVDLTSGDVIDLSKKDCKFSYRNSIFRKKNNPLFITKVNLKLNQNFKTNVSYKSLREYLLKDDIDPDLATPKQVCRAVSSIRNKILPNPIYTPNVGSFFRNLIIDEEKFIALKKILPKIPFIGIDEKKFKIPVAYLIESAGWKGHKEGEVEVSSDHALVIISSGKAKSEDIIGLSTKISEDISNKFNIDLEIEPAIY